MALTVPDLQTEFINDHLYTLSSLILELHEFNIAGSMIRQHSLLNPEHDYREDIRTHLACAKLKFELIKLIREADLTLPCEANASCRAMLIRIYAMEKELQASTKEFEKGIIE